MSALLKRRKERLFKLQNGKCCYCEKPMVLKCREVKSDWATLEHLRTKENGGTDRLDNLAVACYDCNRQRGGMDWLTYKSHKMGELGLCD